MRHLRQFREFLNEAIAMASSALTPIQKAINSYRGTGPKSPDWFTRGEIDEATAWGKSKGIDIAESIDALGSDGKNYWGTPDGVGLDESVVRFYKGEGGLCNELHLDVDGMKRDIVKLDTKFRVGDRAFTNLREALPN